MQVPYHILEGAGALCVNRRLLTVKNADRPRASCKGLREDVMDGAFLSHCLETLRYNNPVSNSKICYRPVCSSGPLTL